MKNFLKIIKFIKNNKLSLWQKFSAYFDMQVSEKNRNSTLNEYLDLTVRDLLLSGAELSWSNSKNLLLTDKDGESIELNDMFDLYSNFSTGSTYTNQTCSRLTKFLLRLKEKELSMLNRQAKDEEENAIIEKYVSRKNQLNNNSVYGSQSISSPDVITTALVLDLVNTSKPRNYGSSSSSSDYSSSDYSSSDYSSSD